MTPMLAGLQYCSPERALSPGNERPRATRVQQSEKTDYRVSQSAGAPSLSRFQQRRDLFRGDFPVGAVYRGNFWDQVVPRLLVNSLLAVRGFRLAGCAIQIANDFGD